MKITYLFFTFFLLCVLNLDAQNTSRADKLFKKFDYRQAYDIYKDIYTKDSSNISIIKKLGECSVKINKTENALRWYSKLNTLSALEGDDIYIYSKLLQVTGEKEKAYDLMSNYIASGTSKWKINPIAKALNNRNVYQVHELGINSEKSDFGPTYYRDKLMFTSGRDLVSVLGRKNKWENQDYLRLFTSKISEKGLETPKRFSGMRDDKFNDGPVCFSADGKEMFITRNLKLKNVPNKIYGLKIYYSRFNKGKWSMPKLLSFNKREFSYGHPSLSKDGKVLFFVSDQADSYGETDIYYVTRNAKGKWSKPINMGDKINTPAKEMTPFISEHNNMLYFSSNGLSGLGGLDVFNVSTKKGSIPQNIGSTINTVYDDFAYIQKGTKGYFASNRGGGESFDNIYSFDLRKFRLKGIVKDKNTGEVLPNSIVSIYNNVGEEVNSMKSDSKGLFEFEVKPNKYYDINSSIFLYDDVNKNVNVEDYLASSALVELLHEKIDVVEIIPTPTHKQPYEEIFQVMVFYNFDKSNIRWSERKKIKEIIEYSKSHPNLLIDISSHTDTRGTDLYNEALSDRRAKSIKSKLISKGIDSSLIISIGKGEYFLLSEAGEYSSEDFQLNRRSEVRFVRKHEILND